MVNINHKKSISIFGAFALSIGTAIGWGSFVLTSSSYLSKAGPLGSIIGLLIGLLIMIVVAYNYHYMMNKYPDTNGGLYSFAKHTFGGDHAFLVSWFLIITYFAIFWANSTSISLFARYIFGDLFQFGFHYSLGGYDVYLGEILLSWVIILLFAGICLLRKSITSNVQVGLAFIFIALIIAVFIGCMIRHEGGFNTFKPMFVNDGKDSFKQILSIVSMSPWAFIGFENISHSSKDFKFKHKHVFKVFVVSLVVTTLIYIMLCQITIATFPSQYSNWVDFLANASSLDGLNAIPLFYVGNALMGNLGKAFLIISLFAIIMTSLIGNIFGLSNLLHSMAEEKVLPTFLAKVDKNGNPLGAIIFIAIISMVMTFFGRIVIGWIVDINNICGVIIYTYIAACAIKSAAKEQNKLSLTLGIIGVVLGVGFALTITIPNIVGDSEIAKESFIILVVWAILGFIYFQFILKNDKNNAYGHSIAVWLGLLSLIIFSAAIWLMDMIKDSDLELMNKISEYVSGQPVSLEDEYIRAIRSDTNVRVIVATSISVLILLVTQVIFFRFFIVLKKKEVEQQRLKDIAEEKATKDAMTGVRNKLAYSYKEKELDNFIAQDLLDLQFAVVVCDVNNLKYINDNLGHEYGDKLIKNAAEIICTVFEHSPVFRIGGDEFVVIIEGKDYENRKELLERLNAISEENNHVEGETVIAAGLATFDKNEHNEFMSVFRDADQNMYSRKMKLKEERNYPRS